MTPQLNSKDVINKFKVFLKKLSFLIIYIYIILFLCSNAVPIKKKTYSIYTYLFVRCITKHVSLSYSVGIVIERVTTCLMILTI